MQSSVHSMWDDHMVNNESLEEAKLIVQQQIRQFCCGVGYHITWLSAVLWHKLMCVVVHMYCTLWSQVPTKTQSLVHLMTTLRM